MPPPAPGQAQTASVTISVTIPAKTTSTKRSPKYVSPSTRSVLVAVTVAGGTPSRTVIPCQSSLCSGTISAPVGTDTFVLSLNDAADGTGNTLASGQTVSTIVAGPNAVSVTFNGTIAKLAISLDKPNPPVRQSTTVAVIVTAYDADNNVIIGPDAYDHSITLVDADTSGATRLTAATVNAPTDTPTVVYNGAWIGGDTATAPITASVPGSASVTPVSVELAPTPEVIEYKIPSSLGGAGSLTLGHDGTLWFVNGSTGVAHVTTSGVFSAPYTLPVGASGRAEAVSIVAGPDGNMWVADTEPRDEAIDSITPAGVITRHSVAEPNAIHSLATMTVGPDGNLWLTDPVESRILRFTMGAVETDFPTARASANPDQIVAGPDGALWFTEQAGNGRIGRITTAGSATDFAYSGWQYVASPSAIVAAPDGDLWFTDPQAGPPTGQIGRMTTSGSGEDFAPNVGVAVGPIIAGPDGALWFADHTLDTVGRISMKGTERSFPFPTPPHVNGPPNGYQSSFAIGSDGNIWFVDPNDNAIGKIVL